MRGRIVHLMAITCQQLKCNESVAGGFLRRHYAMRAYGYGCGASVARLPEMDCQ